MTMLQGKTPISFLQELCTKRGITPQYDLVANEGAIHEPTFVFKVTAGEFIGTGKGPSKKKAKHNAALSVLNQMGGHTNGTGETEYTEGDASTQGAGDGVAGGNPVGELQELTQKRLWRPPVYEYTSEQGPPHAREFICTVHLWKLKETGTGKSKKIAKRTAATGMLKVLKQGGTVPGADGEGEEYDEDGIPLPLKGGKAIQGLTPEASQQITQFYTNVKNSPGRHLVALHGRFPTSGNFCKILKDIATEQKFEVTYVDIQEQSQSGQHQCLVQLSTMPVAVCHGTGGNFEDAHRAAAHNALQYLKIMTKK